MTSVQYVKELINERLTVAAEEIFRVFQETILQYEREIDRQRVLLDIVWKPEIKLHRTELQQQHVCEEEEEEEEEEVLADQQLCDQETNSSLDQEDPEFLQIKVEEEEVCTSLEVEQLVLNQEMESFRLTPICEESEDQTLDLSPDETQTEAEGEYVFSMPVESSVELEPSSDDELLSDDSYVAESQVRKRGKHGNSRSTRKAEPKLEKRHYRKRNLTDNDENFTTLKIHGNKSLKCDFCSKSFSCMSVLDRHMRSHTGEKPYPCNICEKSFSVKGKLKMHMRVHTGEKPYLCNICEKRFRDVSTLKRHVRRHTGEKPHSCQTCQKSFSELSTLKRHMRIHTGEKPFSCNICEKRFIDRSYLSAHMRVHSGKKPSSRDTKKASNDTHREETQRI